MAEPADRATPHMPDNDLDDEPPCWHTEPATPCDWNICRQPERLARGDRGTDPGQQRYRVTELQRTRERRPIQRRPCNEA